MNKILVAIALSAMVLTIACGASKPVFYFVVVDTSLTVKTFEPYEDAYRRVLKRFEGGDRIVMVLAKGPVPNRSNTDLRVISDRALDPPTINMVKQDYEDDLSDVREKLSKDLAAALAQPRSNRTELLYTFDEAAKYFAADKNRKHVMIVLSDMQEDSHDACFERLAPSEEFTADLIKRRGKSQSMLDLTDVRVFVVGAEASSEDRLRNIQKFWIAYLGSTGAVLYPENYGPRLLGFEQATF